MDHIDRCDEETKARRLKEIWVAIAEVYAGKLVNGGDSLKIRNWEKRSRS